MPLPNPTSRDDVIRAIHDYERLGEKAYHAEFGFGPATRYHVLHGGKRYPSKAIAARAVEHETDRRVVNDFSGGWAVARKLAKLDFVIVVDGEREPPGRYEAERVDVEARVVESFETSSREETTTARRAEAALIAEFIASTGRPRDFAMRHSVVTPMGAGLVTDLFDARDGILYEAKSGVGRETMRLALGQILDYRRCLREAGETIAGYRLLVPERPGDDIVELLHEHGVGVVSRHDGVFRVEAP